MGAINGQGHATQFTEELLPFSSGGGRFSQGAGE
jgi:hypothetical protein